MLGTHDDWVQQCLARSEGLLDVSGLRARWRVLRAALGSGDAEWVRGQGWAFQQAIGPLAAGRPGLLHNRSGLAG